MDYIDYLPLASQGIMPWAIGLCLCAAFLAVAVFLAWRRSHARRQHDLKRQWISPNDPVLKTEALKETLSAANFRGTARNTAVFVRMCKAYTVCFFAVIGFLLCGAIFIFDLIADPRQLWDGSDSCLGMWILAAITVVSFLAIRKTYDNARHYRRILSETKA